MRRFISLVFAVVVSLSFSMGQSYEDVLAKFNAGAENINKGEFVQAIDAMTAVLSEAEALGDEGAELVGKAKEQIPLLNYQVAIGYMKQKDYENAIPYLENTVDLAAEYENNADFSAKAMRYLPALLTGVGTQKLRSGDNETALTHFEHAAKYSPDYPKAYLGQGLVFKADYEEDKMIEALTKAMELAQAKNDAKTGEDAKNALAGYFNEQGNMELEDVDPEMEDFSYAIEAFERTLEFDPANGDANYKLTVIYNRMIEYDKAIEHGKKALEGSSDEVKIAAINFELGNAYFGTAEYDLACQSFNNAMVDVFEERALARKEKVPGCN